MKWNTNCFNRAWSKFISCKRKQIIIDSDELTKVVFNAEVDGLALSESERAEKLFNSLCKYIITRDNKE